MGKEMIPLTVRRWRDKQKLKKQKGKRNKCSKCGRRGYFASIIRFYNEGKMYMLCGWCGKIQYIGKYDPEKMSNMQTQTQKD